MPADMNKFKLRNLFGVVAPFFCYLLLATQTASAESIDSRAIKFVANNAGAASNKRVALVIGNGSYQHSDRLPKLSNPPHDAEDIASALRGFGFEVIEKKDQSLEGMNDAIAEFSRKIGDSDAALFYFAGHGLQVRGQNYIIPVTAKLDTEASAEYEGINLNRVLDEMDNGKNRVNIVMLDACRNNPISGKFRSGATRGLATPTNTPKGTVIVYATDPGNVAADGNGRNGLFTAGLLTAFKGDDLSLGGVLERTSEEVERSSNSRQTPYINGPAILQKRFQFIPVKIMRIATTTSALSAPALIVADKPNDVLEIEMVRIPGKNYEIGKYEVTQKEWRTIMGDNPSSFTDCGDTCPVEGVSWHNVQEFIQRLNTKTKLQYRLPTEAEWEYACYGGSQTEYCGGGSLDSVAWYSGNSKNTTHPVGKKQANGYGLYDMSGNVWQWMQDNDGERRVLRGGSWNSNRDEWPNKLHGGFWYNDPDDMRAANRELYAPTFRNNTIGFRLARTLP